MYFNMSPNLYYYIEPYLNSNTIIVTDTMVMKSRSKIHYSNFTSTQLHTVLNVPEANRQEDTSFAN
jgi:hypothetical protein